MNVLSRSDRLYLSFLGIYVVPPFILSLIITFINMMFHIFNFKIPLPIAMPSPIANSMLIYLVAFLSPLAPAMALLALQMLSPGSPSDMLGLILLMLFILSPLLAVILGLTLGYLFGRTCIRALIISTAVAIPFQFMGYLGFLALVLISIVVLGG